MPANYTDTDKANVFPTGTLVCQDSNGVIPCNSTTTPKILGVISDAPAVEGGQKGPNTVLVGLLGQLPLQVSSANGNINPGDPLTSSTKPGVAVKATNTGEIIGRAEEGYSNSDTNIIGTIQVSVNPSFADPNNALSHLAFDSNGNIASNSIDLSAPVMINGQNVSGTIDNALSAISDTLASQSAQIASNSAQIAQTNDLANQALTIAQSFHDQVDATATNVASLSAQVTNLLAGYSNSFTGTQPVVTINDLGKVGIGTSSAAFKLDLQDSTSSAVAQINNLSSDATSVGLQIKLGTTTPEATNKFISFLDGNGNSLGSIRGNGTSNTITFDGNGGDFAEYFKKADAHETFNAGDLVCHATNGGVEKCGDTSNGILGIISDDASFVGAGRNADDPNYVLVGLIGQLKVSVASDSAAIKSGDPLTFSQTEFGKATKATTVGQMIGRALESFDPTHPTDKIMVAINVSWFDPQVALNDKGNLAINGKPMSTSELTVAVKDLKTKSNELSDFEASTSAKLNAQNNTISSLVAQVASLSAKLTDSQQSTVPTASSEGVFALSNLSDQISGLKKQLLDTNLTNALASQDATISGTLNVLGKTTLNELGVTGNITDGVMTLSGLDENGNASINTVGDLKLQNHGAGGIDILSGKIKIDTNGNFISKGELTVKKINIDTKDVLAASLGTITIHAGDTQAVATTSALTKNSHLFATPQNNPVGVATKKTGKDTFIIKIASPQDEDVKIDWWIVN